MQKVSTLTIFFKESFSCHVQTSLTLTLEQEKKASPGSIVTKTQRCLF